MPNRYLWNEFLSDGNYLNKYCVGEIKQHISQAYAQPVGDLGLEAAR